MKYNLFTTIIRYVNYIYQPNGKFYKRSHSGGKSIRLELRGTKRVHVSGASCFMNLPRRERRGRGN